MAKLEFRDLNKIYNHDPRGKKKKGAEEVHAVKSLNMVIEDGEFVGILGPSGCGKTTTLRMVAGMEDITGGQIVVGDTVINDILPKNRGIGLAFEDYALYPPMNVFENIAFCLKAKKVPGGEIKARVDEILRLMKLEDIAHLGVNQLSGGQKQRVNIARAIVRNPGILLLDEPMSHLDGKMRQVLRTEIKRLHNAIKCTTIIVTHDQMEAMSLADKIAIMNFGVLQQYGTPFEVYNDPANVFVANFIGEPPMNLLEIEVVKENGEFFFQFIGSCLKLRSPRHFYSVIEEGGRYTLGIRPTSMSLAGAGEDYHAQFPVEVFENLGEERIISVRVGEEFLTIVITDDVRFKKGEAIRIRANEELIYLFDLETGERVRSNT